MSLIIAPPLAPYAGNVKEMPVWKCLRNVDAVVCRLSAGRRHRCLRHAALDSGPVRRMAAGRSAPLVPAGHQRRNSPSDLSCLCGVVDSLGLPSPGDARLAHDAAALHCFFQRRVAAERLGLLLEGKWVTMVSSLESSRPRRAHGRWHRGACG